MPAHFQEMLQEYENMLKIVLDIRRGYLSGGGALHADCEWFCWKRRAQDFLWSKTFQREQHIEMECLAINDRDANRSIVIQDEKLSK